MKSPAATGIVAVLIFAFLPTLSQSFSTSLRSSSYRTFQFQLQSHPTAFNDIITTNRNGRISRRREIMLNTIAASAAMLGPSSPASAAFGDTTTTTSGAGKFCGTFSDPVNHPGGTRTISLVDGVVVGDYRLAQVMGGGGIGEPKEFVLPAAIIGDRAIIIDFSPKGGPRDFTGVLEKDGAIKFVRDGNLWPRLN